MVSFCRLYNKWNVVIFFVVLAAVSFTVGYNYYVERYDGFFDDKVITESEKTVIDSLLKDSSSVEGIDVEQNYDEVAEVATRDNKIKVNAVYTVITIDKYHKTTNKESMDMPLYLVGLTQMQLVKYYEHYVENMPKEEMEKGLLNIRIGSFSSDELIINKTYDVSTVVYYVTEHDGYVKVYYADRKTLYENTGIEVKDLPPVEQKNIKFGMYVEDKDELISILESYSS